MDRQVYRDELLSFAVELWGASRATDVVELFKTRAGRFGFPVFAFGEIDAARPSRSTMHVVEWPAEWLAAYMKERFFEQDPLLDLVRRGFAPFTWTERKAVGGLSRSQMRGFEAAREFGWGGGLTISVPRGGTRFGMLSLAGLEDAHLSPVARAALASMAVLAYDRFRSLASTGGARPIHSAGLTHREIDCLSHVACGLSDAALAEKLGISTSTAHEHVESAKRKLGARTRAEAVAVAVALGSITP